MLFRAREIREGATADEQRRQLNEALKLIERDLSQALSRRRVSEVVTASSYAPGFGEVVRGAPPSTGQRLILPEPNLAALDARVTYVQVAATGALTVEVVNGTINGATTLSYLAGIGTIEFILTADGWFAWSVSMVASLPLTALASQAAKSVIANATNAAAVPAALAASAALQHVRVNAANNALEWSTITLSELPAQASETVLGNISGSSAVPAAVALADLDSTSIVYDAASHTFQRAAFTSEVTANQNANALTVARATDFSTTPWTGNHKFESQLLLGGEQDETGTGAINVTLGSVVRLRFSDATGNHTVGTISACADGRLLIVEFSGTGTHTTTHSTASNAVSCPGNVDLVITGRGGYIAVGRDAGGTNNWKVVATTN